MQDRQTKQKQIIYDALCALNHPTATEVYAHVRALYPTVSRATVFRVLGGFADSGKALELRSSGQEMRYDFNTYAHSHARCVSCGQLCDVKTSASMEENLQAEPCDGFDLQGVHLEFYGVCKDCKTPKS